MFDPTEFCAIEERDGRQYVTIDPHEMYPATIARIREVLETDEFPEELVQRREDENGEEQVSRSRASVLLANAKQVPAASWDAALMPRENFLHLSAYAHPGKRPPLEMFADNLRGGILDIWNRGDALEVAMGWFLHALRCKIGGSHNRILTGHDDPENPPAFYYYQL